MLEQAILATDLASYFEKRDKFKTAADDGEIDWQVIETLFRHSQTSIQFPKQKPKWIIVMTTILIFFPPTPFHLHKEKQKGIRMPGNRDARR